MKVPQVQVYVNWSRLVADCGQDGCSDAREVDPGQAAMSCERGHVSELIWDPQIPEVTAVLNERADESKRNWFPAGHPLALSSGQPHGQSIAELQAEHRDRQAAADAVTETRRDQLAALLGEHGLTINDDGTIKGAL